LCPLPDATSTTIAEGDEDESLEAEATAADESAVDTRYNGLLGVIDDLKNQLIDEKQKNIRNRFYETSILPKIFLDKFPPKKNIRRHIFKIGVGILESLVV
jgi:hypothetical protein